MPTQTTNEIEVSVESFFQQDYSNPVNWEYMFAYRVTITNKGIKTVKLLKRYWYIFDSCGEFKEIEGVGVVGKQPILKSGESHQYISGCSLKSEMGKMRGEYVMEYVDNGKLFSVDIPEFDLIAPLKMN